MKRGLLVTASLLVIGCSNDAPARPPAAEASSTLVARGSPPMPQQASSPEPSTRDGEAAGVKYLEHVSGGASPKDALPLIVAIHGLGDRPDSFAGLFEGFRGKARLIFPYGDRWQTGFAWWPPAPTPLDLDRAATGSERSARRLVAMMAEIAKTRPTAGKPIVTGFSQGGMVSFALAVLHPEIVADVVPISGLLAPALSPSSWPVGKIAPPVLALHGDADDRVPIAMDRQTVARLRELGFSAELREYPRVGHTVSAEMQRDLFARLDAAVTREAGR